MADLSSDREARAERYFKQDLKDQREWYGRRASLYKNWAQLLGLVIIGAGAATSLVQVFTPATWVPPLTAGLGALVALSEGWQRIARYNETWVAYRTASERMKREHRLYLNGAGSYRGLDDGAAFLQLVESVEAIVAEEQQVYWRSRASQGGGEQITAAIPKKDDPQHAQ
jgi:Protein of unknown function (DUF4231)